MDCDPLDIQEFIHAVTVLLSSRLTDEEKTVLAAKCDTALRELHTWNYQGTRHAIAELCLIKACCSSAQ